MKNFFFARQTPMQKLSRERKILSEDLFSGLVAPRGQTLSKRRKLLSEDLFLLVSPLPHAKVV